MPAYVSATVTVKNPEKLQTYVSQVGAVMAAHGGKPVLRGTKNKDLAGHAGFQVMALFEFPDEAAAEAWYASDAYQALIPVRDEAADMTITILSAP